MHEGGEHIETIKRRAKNVSWHCEGGVTLRQVGYAIPLYKWEKVVRDRDEKDTRKPKRGQFETQRFLQKILKHGAPLCVDRQY
jgi:hypothetical protein